MSPKVLIKMKKIIFLVILVLSSLTAQAQVIVDVNDFVNNPSKFNGKTIVLQGVIAKRSTSNSATSNVAPATVLTTPGAVNPPTPSSTVRNQPNTNNAGTNANAAPVVRCSAPKNWERLEVQLPNNYDGCFVIFNKMANTLPMNKDVRMDITVKVDTRFMHRVTKIKVLP